MTQPIRPDEVASHKATLMPPGVIEAFNELIARHWDGSQSKFTQNEAVLKIMGNMGIEDDQRNLIYQNKWLDVETIYAASGWVVEYDKPAYCENYKATFCFKKA